MSGEAEQEGISDAVTRAIMWMDLAEAAIEAEDWHAVAAWQRLAADAFDERGNELENAERNES